MIFEKIIENIHNFQKIGEGGNREVYDIGNGLVLKVAIDCNIEMPFSIVVNRKEYDVYHTSDEKGYLCPVEWISEDGMYLIMKNANYLDKPVTDLSLDEFSQKIVDLGYVKCEVDSPMNWVGHYLVDYGWAV